MSLLNNCAFIATAGGITDFGVSSAMVGSLTPAQSGAVNSAVYSYCARSLDQTQWEIGRGTYSTTGPTLARTTVLLSSNANAKVNFASTPIVAIDALAEDIPAPYTPARAINLVQQYGVDNTGATDVTSTVQGIINSFGTNSGAEIFLDGIFTLGSLTLPAGSVFKIRWAGEIRVPIGQTFVIPPYLAMEGEAGTYADQFGPQGSNVGLITGSSTSNPVVQMAGGTQSSLRNVRIAPPVGIGLQITPSATSLGSGVYLENVTCRAQRGNPNSIPLQVDSVFWIKMVDCTFIGDLGSHPRPVQFLQTITRTQVAYLGLIDCRNLRLNGGGIYFYSCTGPLSSGFLFEDTQVENMVAGRSMFEFDTTFATFTGSIAAGTNTLVVSAMAAVNTGHIEIGQLLTGTNVLASTYVTGFVSGTPGGVGTYTVSQTHPAGVASTTITTPAVIISNIKIVRPKNFDAIGGTYLIKNSGAGTRDIVVEDWDSTFGLVDPVSAPIIGGVKLTVRHQFPYSFAIPTPWPALWAQNYSVDYWGALDAKLITAPRGPQAIGGYALAVEQDPTTWPAATGGGVLTTGIIGVDGLPTAGQLSGPNGAAITLNNTVTNSFAIGDWLIPGCWVQSDPVQAGPASFTASINGTTMSVSAVASGYLSVGQTISAPSGPVSFNGWIDGGTVLHVVANTVVGTIQVGQQIGGPGVATGTAITALGTGYGADGTYTISPSQANVGSSGSPVAMNVGVKAGTLISAFGTGTGGVGDYTISTSQNAQSQTMTGAGRNPANVELLMAPTTFILDANPVSGYRAFLDSEHGPAKLGSNAWTFLCQAHKITTIGANPAKATLVLMRTTSAGVTNFDKPGVIHIPCCATFTASVAAGALSTLVVSAVASGRIMVGMVIAGGVAAGSKILALGTGVGGTGNYTITAQGGAVASQAMTGNRNIPDADVMTMARSLTAWSSRAQPGDVSLLDTQKLMLGGGVQLFSAPSPPSTGVYNVGARCLNSSPTPGGIEGWTCTGSSPLTWKTFGFTDSIAFGGTQTFSTLAAFQAATSFPSGLTEVRVRNVQGTWPPAAGNEAVPLSYKPIASTLGLYGELTVAGQLFAPMYSTNPVNAGEFGMVADGSNVTTARQIMGATADGTNVLVVPGLPAVGLFSTGMNVADSCWHSLGAGAIPTGTTITAINNDGAGHVVSLTLSNNAPTGQHLCVICWTETMTGTDNTPMLQAALDFAMQNRYPDIRIPLGKYTFNDQINMGWGNTYYELHLIGTERDSYQSDYPGVVLYFTKTDRMAISIQGGRNILISGLAIVGRHRIFSTYAQWFALSGAGSILRGQSSDPQDYLDPRFVPTGSNPGGIQTHCPHAAITQDAYSGVQPTDHYPTRTYPAWVVNAGLPQANQYNLVVYTSEIIIERCSIIGFAVHIASGLNTNNQGDFLKVRDMNMCAGAYGLSVNNGQSRGVEFRNIDYAGFHTLFSCSNLGIGTGEINGPLDNIQGGQSYQSFDFNNMSVCGPVTIHNHYFEGQIRLGNFNASASFAPLVQFVGGIFSFHLYNISNCLMTSGQYGKIVLRGCQIGGPQRITSLIGSSGGGGLEIDGGSFVGGAAQNTSAALVQAVNFCGGILHGTPRFNMAVRDDYRVSHLNCTYFNAVGGGQSSWVHDDEYSFVNTATGVATRGIATQCMKTITDIFKRKWFMTIPPENQLGIASMTGVAFNNDILTFNWATANQNAADYRYNIAVGDMLMAPNGNAANVGTCWVVTAVGALSGGNYPITAQQQNNLIIDASNNFVKQLITDFSFAGTNFQIIKTGVVIPSTLNYANFSAGSPNISGVSDGSGISKFLNNYANGDIYFGLANVNSPNPWPIQPGTTMTSFTDGTPGSAVLSKNALVSGTFPLFPYELRGGGGGGGTVASTREVTINTSFTAADSDDIIGLNPTTSASFTVTLPLSSSRGGRSIMIADLKGFCAAFPVTVAMSGSDTCLGQTTLTIGNDFQSLLLRPRASGGWFL